MVFYYGPCEWILAGWNVSGRMFAIGDWVMRYYPAGKKCKLDSVWTGPYLVVALLGWTVGIQKHPDVPMILIHCQDVKKVPQPSGVQSWITAPQPVGAPAVPMLGASTVAHTGPTWGQQVAVMFQIVSTMALELPSFLGVLENLRGISPNVHLDCEPWGHINHEDINCGCQSSDRTVTYVHDLTINGRGPVHSPDAGVASSWTNGHLCIEPSWERGRPGLVPFVSDMPGAYGRLLLTGYVRWRTGLLVSSDRGRGSADVS